MVLGEGMVVASLFCQGSYVIEDVPAIGFAKGCFERRHCLAAFGYFPEQGSVGLGFHPRGISEVARMDGKGDRRGSVALAGGAVTSHAG